METIRKRKQRNKGGKIMKTLKQKNAGITLIALVITIIVLLILAGITINLTIGQDGIIKRAEEAGKNYTQAAEKEQTEIAEFTDLTDKVIDKVTQKYHTMVDGVPVPKGFKHTEGTKETGFVIKNDTDGNEFVWVPCTIDGANGSIKYNRYAFTRDGGINQTLNASTGEIKQGQSQYVFTDDVPSDEQSSVRIYGGFYIGRYESGVMGYDSNVNKTPDGSKEWTGYSNGKLVIQSNQQVWNYITRDKAKSISESLYSKTKGDSVNSKLCSSYAWDTTLKFIDSKNAGYSTNSTQGNYSDKADTLGKPAKTGLSEKVNNIYDMGGNVWEWTTGSNSDNDYDCPLRGGDYSSAALANPAAYRGSGNSSAVGIHFSFRTTIFL